MVGASGADVLAAIIAGMRSTCRSPSLARRANHYDAAYTPQPLSARSARRRRPPRRCSALRRRVVCAGAMGTVLSQSAGSLAILANRPPGQTGPRSGWAATATA